MPSKKQAPSIDRASTPRERFMANGAKIKEHQDIVDSDAFEEASWATFVDLAEEIAHSIKDLNTAAAAGYKLQGMMEYRRRLKTFTDTDKIETPEPFLGLQPTEPPRRV